MFIGYLPYGAEDTFLAKLQTAGCHQIVREQQAEGQSGLSDVVSGLNEGDVLLLCHSSHAGSEADFLRILVQVGRKCAHFVSIDEGFDTLRDTALHYAEAAR
ncbi:hypothetical protein SAMN05216327_102560 [Dyadobacter sp. SG02]|uniref:hypothetical protein n=1 Tax=Dyadobacter sp. SG02 TaxID=1855291 RepID=UPI0008AB7391|nr:hypothetical protein [Dyadobacter sp. SG02]SEI57895.1 hypothetical protein SAMN05216327_102560 [Dyadobacter sp. SG02]